MNKLKLLLIPIFLTFSKLCLAQSSFNEPAFESFAVKNNPAELNTDQSKKLKINDLDDLSSNEQKKALPSATFNTAEERRVYVTETMKPNTDYFISPTGFGLLKGMLRATNTYFIISNATYGVTDNFSLSAGFTPYIKLLTINAKYAIHPSEYLHFAIVANLATTINSGIRLNGGTIGGLCTLGKSDYNITLGVNLGKVNAISIQKPIFNISGISRISEKFAITMDNYFISKPKIDVFDSVLQTSTTNTSPLKLVGFFSYGVRLLKPKTFIDFGLISPLKNNIGDGDYFFALPYFKVTRQVF